MMESPCNLSMRQDVFIMHADAITCLGQGKTLETNLQMGKSGLTSVKAVFPDSSDWPEWYDPSLSQVGCVLGLSDPQERIQSLLKLLLISENLELLESCDSLIFGGAFGDLVNQIPGNPHVSIASTLKQVFKKDLPFSLIASACSSGTDALALGFLSIAQGKKDCVAVLAIDSLDPFKLMQHIELKTQSLDRARPFSANRSGTSFGEGAALMLLASETGLRKWHKSPFARVLSAGLSCDAMDLTAPDESGYFPSLAIARAMKSAGIAPFEVNYINAHGSGTLLSDLAESRALRRVFTEHLPSIAVSSTKGATGHLLGATGLVEATITAWAIKNQQVPATAGLLTTDPTLLVHPLCEGPSKAMNVDIALSVTLGFGGVNSCVALGRI